jgi:hypothetical protein
MNVWKSLDAGFFSEDASIISNRALELGPISLRPFTFPDSIVSSLVSHRQQHEWEGPRYPQKLVNGAMFRQLMSFQNLITAKLNSRVSRTIRGLW